MATACLKAHEIYYNCKMHVINDRNVLGVTGKSRLVLQNNLKTSSFVEEALQLMHLRVMKAEEDMNQQNIH